MPPKPPGPAGGIPTPPHPAHPTPPATLKGIWFRYDVVSGVMNLSRQHLTSTHRSDQRTR
ncbi:hypothetical protein E2C01_085803 [Portunus trituberculatus]|uniref:Uncharacterized protein n=1 Tax=Portunus trituberculatus TaxID=210409 RepID=A0A5B7J3P9_PORTR|nr:hypothetical protein [Portunus trituberculatus]